MEEFRQIPRVFRARLEKKRQFGRWKNSIQWKYSIGNKIRWKVCDFPKGKGSSSWLMYIVFHPSGMKYNIHYCTLLLPPLVPHPSPPLPLPSCASPRLVRAKHLHSRGLTKFLELLKFLHKKDTLWKGQTTQLSPEHHDESLPTSLPATSRNPFDPVGGTSINR